MEKNENQRLRFQARSAVAVMAVTLSVLATAGLAYAGNPKDKKPNDNKEEATQVYNHTYDEVFQAAQERIERNGWFIDKADKDKGIIITAAIDKKCPIDIHIESVSPKPETRVTVRWRCQGWALRHYSHDLGDGYLSGLQKVLATYR